MAGTWVFGALCRTDRKNKQHFPPSPAPHVPAGGRAAPPRAWRGRRLLRAAGAAAAAARSEASRGTAQFGHADEDT